PREALGEFFGRLQHEQSELLAHQHLGLVEIQSLAGLGELFDTLVVFENYPVDRSALARPVAGLRLSSFEAHDATHYPLSLTAASIGRLTLRLQSRPDLFERSTVEAMGQRLVTLLEAVVAEPAQPIGRLELLTPEERRQLLVEWNATAREVPAATLPALFEAQVARSPEATAVVFEERTLSYTELNGRANRLAHHLIAQGVGPESLVGIALERSIEMVVALVGILKAGAAYLPLDPDYPEERLAYMLRDAQPACVLSAARLAGRLRLPEGVAELLVDEPETAGALAQRPETNPTEAERTQPLGPQNPAYLIYTSGSTGTPKGVVVTHAGIPSLVAAQITHFTVTPGARVLQFASLSFDATLWEIAMALGSGATLVLPVAEERSGDALAEVIRSRGVTHATLPPAALANLPEDLPLEALIVAGEACSAALVARWSQGRE